MSVNVIDTIKPKNGGSFPVVEAVDVAVSGSTRLDTALAAKANTADLAAKADKSELTDIRTTIALKANQSSLDATNVVVSSKAAQSSLDALSVIVANKADKKDYDDIYAAIDGKADKAYVNTSVTTETNARIAADNNLQAQIDQIEISASAEAVVAPEVIAARVDADGVTYATLKAREDADSKNFTDFKNGVVTSNINYLINAEYFVDCAYYTENPNAQPNFEHPRYLPNANVGAYAAIPVFEGKTYYYNSLYAYFCWIKYGDANATRFSSSVDTKVSGSFTAESNGVVYITIDKRIYSDNVAIFTDSEQMATYKAYDTYYSVKDSIRDNTLYTTLLNGGLKKSPSSYNGTGANGASIVGTSIVIPQGQSGYQSFIGAYFDLTDYHVSTGKVLPCIIAINKGGYSGNIIFDGNYYLGYKVVKKLLYKVDADGTEWYLVYFDYTDNAYFKLFLQIDSSFAVGSETTITIKDAYVISQEFADYVVDKVISAESDIKTVTKLTVGEGKQYTSLRTALEYATEHYSADTIYEVQLYYSEYDVADDITAEELLTSSDYIGLAVTKNVRLVGMNNYRKCVIKLELASTLDPSVRQRISTLNLKDNAELENLTVTAKRARYAIHDDYTSGTENKKTIKNCKFYSDSTYYHRAYGAGFRSGDDWTFENCIFDMADTEAYAPFSAHNNLGFTKAANIKFVNCRFSGGQYGAMFGSLTNNTNILNTIIFEGCKAPDSVPAVRLYEESAGTYGKGCLMSVTGFGNSFDNTDVLIQVTDGQDYSDQVDLL